MKTYFARLETDPTITWFILKTLPDALRGNFVVINLGSGGDTDYGLPAELKRSMTLVEIDAAAGAATSGQYHKKISVNQVVAGLAGPRIFRRNIQVSSSSLLEPKQPLIDAYELGRYFQVVERSTVDCTTLPRLLSENQLGGFDLLKTDLEGMDFDVIRSCEPLLPRALCLQCEVRFQPFYEGEPFAHEVFAYLHDRGFELIGLKTEHWKYKTPGRFWQNQGRPAWADCLFTLRPEKILELDAEIQPLALAKQIILVAMLGKKNYGEFLLGQNRVRLPAEWLPALEGVLKARCPSPKELFRLCRGLFLPLEMKLWHLLGRCQHASYR